MRDSADRFAVLFDCDGVLVDSEPALAEIAARVLNERGLAARPEDFAPYIGTGEDSYIGNVVRQYGGEFTADIKAEVYQAYIREAAHLVKPFPGLLEALALLQEKGIPYAVASSADQIKLEANLKALGAAGGSFGAVISGSDIERKKPWPDIYLLAAERLGVVPEICIVVEDAVAGIQAACAAGMHSVGFAGSVPSEQLKEAGATLCIESMTDLISALEQIAGY